MISQLVLIVAYFLVKLDIEVGVVDIVVEMVCDIGSK